MESFLNKIVVHVIRPVGIQPLPQLGFGFFLVVGQLDPVSKGQGHLLSSCFLSSIAIR